MNDINFLKMLDLPLELNSKIKLVKAKLDLNRKQNRNKISILFSKNDNFSVEELKLFFHSFIEFKNKYQDIELEFVDIKIDLINSQKTEVDDLYGFLILFLNHLNEEKVDLSKFYVEYDPNENLLIYIANNITFQKITKDIKYIGKIFSNLSIFKNKLITRQDASLFNIDKVIEDDKKNLQKQTENLILKTQKAKLLNFKNNSKVLVIKKEEQLNVSTYGEILNFKIRKINKNTLFTFLIKQKDGEIITASKWNIKDDIDFSKNKYLSLFGDFKFDNYSNNYIFGIKSFSFIDEKLIVKDLSNNRKRAEFHVHTKMSTMDGVGLVSDYFKVANSSNILAIAFTDHDSLQSFPEIYKASKKYPNVKPIYGLELSIYDDINERIVYNPISKDLRTSSYVYFDLETTGISPLVNEIIEFGGIRVKDGKIIDSLQIFVKPKVNIPKEITKITKITNDDVKDAKSIDKVLPIILDFIKDDILVAHNAKFDYSFLNAALSKNKMSLLKNPVIDTLKVSWLVNPHLKNHRLGTVARNENQTYDDSISHRADYDAKILRDTFENMLQKLYDLNIRDLLSLSKAITNPLIQNRLFLKHINILVKNQDGLKELYKIISDAHIKYFNSRFFMPSFPLSKLLEIKNNNNLLLGSSCANGLLWEEVNFLNSNLEEIISYFDYFEIFPPEVYSFLNRDNKYTKKQIEEIILEIINLGVKNNKPVIVTSDAHYVLPDDKIARDIYIANKGLGGRMHSLFVRNHPEFENPNQHLRTSDDLILNFNFIKDEKLKEDIIFKNGEKLLSLISDVKPIKDELYPPHIKDSTAKFKKLIEENLLKRYGKNPDKLILERINREVTAITKHKYAIIYYLSSLAVKKSLEDGYLVGSRGSVGSSLAATLSDITEVNPLEPHYICDACKHHQFVKDVLSGYDLKSIPCPICKSEMRGDGHWIQFETFLGFNGDKVPDIDLNFSREYQSKIHDFIKELLGEKNVIRAGTISTVANRTAFGYVKNWIEVTNQSQISNEKIDYLASKVEGTKRTTGQHPGGLIVIPNDKEIYDFTPINYPGNDKNSNWLTTHFDFHSIHDNLLKLDLLGHLDPSMLKMLESLTNINPIKIPMNDLNVLSLFNDNKALKYIKNYTNETLGILGLPEFGTAFVRDLVRDAKPKTFSDLVMISGLSHGTDVWVSNAKSLIDKKIATLRDVISVRDDIMKYLISKNVPSLTSFKIMESVRKGDGLTKEWEELMLKHDVPSWYIDSCQKIKYIFPKAHAVAYVIMAYRIAWYKIYYPLEYYATFFSKRDTEWDILSLNNDVSGILKWKTNYRELKEKTERDKAISETYTIVLEMYSRGFKISPINLKKSKASTWVIDYENKQLIPPFMIIDGLGEAAALKLVSENDLKSFASLQDFKFRSGLNKTLIEKFDNLGIIKDLIIEEKKVKQISMDDFFNY